MKLEDILNPNRDYSPKTNANSIQDFMEGTLYRDFLGEINVRIESLRDFNEECDSKQYLETRGAIKGLRMIASIFDNLYHNAVSDQTKGEE
jgi:hypothetical protein